MRRPKVTVNTITVPPMIAFIIAIAVLYYARQILIPFALAMLCAFLLSPVVKRLETIRVPRIPAVLCVLLIAFGFLGGIGWVVTDQLVEIINELPHYSQNIHSKIGAVQAPGGLTKLLQNIDDLGQELRITASNKALVAAPRKLPRSARALAASNGSPETAGQPLKVEVVAPPPSALQSMRDLFGPLLGPLETAGIVIIFTIFMLLDREDLRNRLLSLIGQRQLHVTTKALDDAARRVSRYLLLQFVVNASLGAVVGCGLYLIGVRSFLLWGVLAMLLRFLPYVGIVGAGLMPFLLAVATTDGWRSPVLVLALFLTAELITGNMIEPMLYGAHTGLSAVAILTAVVFWTALWGPVGLILSTPLTVCLGVLGRYSPHLQFLDILLGDSPALSQDALFYQRLLALDQQEALAVIETFLRNHPLVELYDQVIIPALAMAERDRHGGQLESRREAFIVQSIHEFVTELADSEPALRKKRRNALFGDDRLGMGSGTHHANRVFCLAAHDMADEITAAMLAQVAERDGFPTLSFPYTESPVSMLDALAPQAGDIVCVSSVPPLAVTHARTTSQEIRDAFPDVILLVGLWRYPEATTRTVGRLQQSTGGVVVTTLGGALEQIKAASIPLAVES